MAANRCLFSPDTLHPILRFLSLDHENEPPPQSHDIRRERSKTLRHMALTCRFFSAHVPGYLWEFLDSMIPLFMQLPGHLWKLEKIRKGWESGRTFLHLIGQPCEDDWEKVQTYASLVKVYDDTTEYTTNSLGSSHGPSRVNHYDFNRVNNQKLFTLPRLVYFRTNLILPGVILVNPHLQTIDLGLMIASDEFVDQMISDCPGLKTLKVFTDPGDGEEMERVSKLVCHYHHLDKVQLLIESLTDDALRHLSQRSFKSIHLSSFSAPTDDDWTERSFPRLSFARVTELTLGTVAGSKLSAFLMACEFPILASLKVEWEDSMTALEFGALVRAIVASSPPTLRKLDITIKRDSGRFTCEAITPAELAPLFARFTGLVELTLGIQCVFGVVDDDDVRVLSVAFPELRFLSVGLGGRKWVAKSGAMLKGNSSQECAKLARLGDPGHH